MRKYVIILPLLLLLGYFVMSAQTSQNNLVNRFSTIRGIVVPESESGGDKTELRVTNQTEFDAISTNVNKLLREGSTNIIVNLTKGTYYFKEEHIRLSKINLPSASIQIKGNGSTIIAAGNDCTGNNVNKDGYYCIPYPNSIEPTTCFISANNDYIDMAGEVYQSDEPIEIIDPQKKYCRLKCNNQIGDSRDMTVLITTWYKSMSFPVDKVEDGYIWFYAPSLARSKSYDCYNVNLDVGFTDGSCMPRYQVFNNKRCAPLYYESGNLYVKSNIKKLHECASSRFLEVNEVSLKNIKVSGLNFYGNHISSSLLHFHNVVSEQVLVEKCKFQRIHNYIVLNTSTDNLVFRKNKIKQCYHHCLLSDNSSQRTNVYENVFEDNGSLLVQHCCVDCSGTDYYIFKNTFVDFTYSAINVGLYYTEKMIHPCRGIVEYNDIYYSKRYSKDFKKHTFMDSGAIYVTTQNDPSIIRFNKVHNYIGMSANRGIFCDTGVKNVVIYGNEVWDVPNSHCIELWYVKEPEPFVPDANTGNYIMGNIIDGSYLFTSNPDGNNYVGRNYCIDSYKSVTKGVKRFDTDVSGCGKIVMGKLRLNRRTKREIKNTFDNSIN